MALTVATSRLNIARLVACPKHVYYQRFHTLLKQNCRTTLQRDTIKFKIPNRKYFWIFKKKTAREIISLDNVPAYYELIYRCGFDHYFLSTQYICFFTAAIVGLIVIYKISLEDMPKIGEKTPVVLNEDMKFTMKEDHVFVFILAYATLYAVIHLFVQRLPMRLYVYPRQQKYLLCFYGAIPNQIKKVTLKAGDLVHTPGSPLIPWSDDTYTNFKTGQKFVLPEDFFRTTSDLEILLGLREDPEAEKNISRNANENMKNKKR